MPSATKLMFSLALFLGALLTGGLWYDAGRNTEQGTVDPGRDGPAGRMTEISDDEFPKTPASSEPSAEELAQRSALATELGGDMLFDSNRSGTFGIHVMSLSSGEIRALADGPLQEMQPDPSPDGEWIVYSVAETTKPHAKTDVWIMDRNGGQKRLFVKNARMATFSADGKTVYFERAHKRLYSARLDGSNIRKIFPYPGSGFERRPVINPRISPDGQYVAFTSDRGGRWNAWVAPLTKGKGEAVHINAGCQPDWIPGSRELAWVKRHGALTLAGIYRFALETGEKSALQDRDDPFGHEYFPTVLDARGSLAFASCPGREHSHVTSNYQIFVARPNGERVRVTFDPYTNRWPKVLAFREVR